jgi:WD40 repeat protein
MTAASPGGARHDPDLTREQRYVLTGANDLTVRRWDIETGTNVLCHVGHDDIVWRVAMRLDGSLAASGSGDDTVMLWRPDVAVHVARLPFPDCVAATAFTPDGSELVVGCDDSTLYVLAINPEHDDALAPSAADQTSS